jgi:hypothetical protein
MCWSAQGAATTASPIGFPVVSQYTKYAISASVNVASTAASDAGVACELSVAYHQRETSMREGSTSLLESHGHRGSYLSSHLVRVWSVIQFTSQVLPPSAENDCSKWGDAESSPVQSNRTKMLLSSKVSCA